jgi:hypothetical protein
VHPSRHRFRSAWRSANPIPVCSRRAIRICDELWTNSGLSVDGLSVQLRGFCKSHHFVRARPGLLRDCSR